MYDCPYIHIRVHWYNCIVYVLYTYIYHLPWLHLFLLYWHTEAVNKFVVCLSILSSLNYLFDIFIIILFITICWLFMFFFAFHNAYSAFVCFLFLFIRAFWYWVVGIFFKFVPCKVFIKNRFMLLNLILHTL